MSTREKAIRVAYERLRAVTLADLIQYGDPDEHSAVVAVDALVEAGLLRDDPAPMARALRPWYWRTIVLLPLGLVMVALASVSIALNGAWGWLAAGLVIGSLAYWTIIQIQLRRRDALRHVPGKWTSFHLSTTRPARPRRAEPTSPASHTEDTADGHQGANPAPATGTHERTQQPE